MFTKIAVLGLGKVGRWPRALSDAGFEVAGFDARPIPTRRSPSMPSTLATPRR